MLLLDVLDGFFSVADATVPSIYDRAFASVDPTNSGETSVNSLSRVLSTSSLPAGTIDKVREQYVDERFSLT